MECKSRTRVDGDGEGKLIQQIRYCLGSFLQILSGKLERGEQKVIRKRASVTFLASRLAF